LPIRPSIKKLRVSLFIPCFIDQLYPEVAISMVRVLERLGHAVEYDERQTCCGQPAFNSGYWAETRPVAERMMGIFKDAEVIVSASGSCGAMLKVFYPELFKNTPQEAAALAMSPKVYEFSDFLVSVLGVTDVGARFPAKVTFHDGCHGLRELGVKAQPRALLAKVRDLELIEMNQAETCCGFGGTFAAKMPSISTAMGEVKCINALETGADFIVSNDSSCLMQIQGLLDRQGQPMRSLHLAEVLARVD
jgi:L-lactate dehydrogenase complex protein LldE